MTERKSRFGDRSALPADPALKVLELRPRGVAADPQSATTYPGRLAAEDQQNLVGRLQKAREEANGSRELLEAERAERDRERSEGMLLLRVDPEIIGLTEFANRNELSLSTKDDKFKAFKESIRRNGQDTPVRVRPGATGADKLYELVEGHRRHAAIRELNWEIEGGFKILVRVDAHAADLVDLCLKMYRENADREDLIGARDRLNVCQLAACRGVQNAARSRGAHGTEGEHGQSVSDDRLVARRSLRRVSGRPGYRATMECGASQRPAKSICPRRLRG